MKSLLKGVGIALLFSGGSALANDSVMAEIAKPQQWAIQTGDYANSRYSTLDKITKDNVKDLRVAWTFSTGVLRGHEGSPLVIGDIMYVHTPRDNLEAAFGGVLRHITLGGDALHDDDDPRHITILSDDERPLVQYGDRTQTTERRE